jgi:hypothetical protein
MDYREPKIIKVCPKCSCRILKWIEHETYSYFLCYACGWTSMPAREIGKAMAKESIGKLRPNIKQEEK